MTDHLQQLEARLRAQPLSRPSADLDTRMAALFQDAAAPGFSRPDGERGKGSGYRLRWWMPAAAGLAAAIALLAALLPITTDETSDPAAPPMIAALTEPIEITETWTSVEPGGLIYIEDASEPLRTAYYQSVQHTSWVDPQTNATIELTIPTEEVVLLPVQAY